MVIPLAAMLVSTDLFTTNVLNRGNGTYHDRIWEEGLERHTHGGGVSRSVRRVVRRLEKNGNNLVSVLLDWCVARE